MLHRPLFFSQKNIMNLKSDLHDCYEPFTNDMLHRLRYSGGLGDLMTMVEPSIAQATQAQASADQPVIASDSRLLRPCYGHEKTGRNGMFNRFEWDGPIDWEVDGYFN